MKILDNILGKRKVQAQLDPRSVTPEQAERFFVNEKHNKVAVDLMKPFINKASLIFDVGSNSGYFSKEILEAGFFGTIVLFEPIPNLMSISVQALSRYSSEKIFVNSALGEHEGEVNLHMPHDSNIGWITAVSEKARSDETISVRVSDASRYARLYRPEFIKIDVEGYEVFVLRPILPLIGEGYRPAFYVELGWGVSNPHWSAFLIAADHLCKQGYCFYLVEESLKEIDLTYLHSLDHTVDVFMRWQT